MSIAWMTRVWAASEPEQATERLMLLALADSANDQGVCWPSMAHLRSKCCLKTVRGARKVVARLEASGFVARVEQPGQRNHYRLSEERLSTGEATPERADRGRRRPRNRGTGVDAADPGPVGPPTPERRDRGPRNGGTGDPLINHQKNQQQAGMPAHAPTRGDDGAAVGGDGLGEMPSAAAASFEEDGEDRSALVAELVARGVDASVAERLVAAAEAEHVQAMLARGEREAKGPGWYVRAIADGYREAAVEGGARRRYSHAEVLAALQQKGIVLTSERPMDHYFDVRREGETVWFEPTAYFG